MDACLSERWISGLREPTGSHIPDAAEADIRSRAIRSVGGARRDAIPIAVGPVAQIRAPFHDPLRAVGWPSRIRVRGRDVPGRVKPVTAPFPGIAGDGVQAVTVGGKGIDLCRRGVPVFPRIVIREVALPDVAQMFTSWGEFIAPG